MSEREQARGSRGAEKVTMYDAPDVRQTASSGGALVERPKDLIRWGSVIAGIFAALATLIALGVLGLAIGFSSFNYGDPARNFGIGAGIWGAISVLVAFIVGGWLAGRSASYSGSTSGILNGAMVWFVAIPLLVYALGTGIGALAGTVGGVAGTAAQVAGSAVGNAAGAVANNPALQGTAQAGAQNPALQATAGAGVQDLTNAAQGTAQALQQQAPQIANQAADVGASAAWGTLLSLGLAAAAAIGGGYLGSRTRDAVVRTPTRRA